MLDTITRACSPNWAQLGASACHTDARRRSPPCRRNVPPHRAPARRPAGPGSSSRAGKRLDDGAVHEGDVVVGDALDQRPQHRGLLHQRACCAEHESRLGQVRGDHDAVAAPPAARSWQAAAAERPTPAQRPPSSTSHCDARAPTPAPRLLHVAQQLALPRQSSSPRRHESSHASISPLPCVTAGWPPAPPGRRVGGPPSCMIPRARDPRAAQGAPRSPFPLPHNRTPFSSLVISARRRNVSSSICVSGPRPRGRETPAAAITRRDQSGHAIGRAATAPRPMRENRAPTPGADRLPWGRQPVNPPERTKGFVVYLGLGARAKPAQGGGDTEEEHEPARAVEQ